MLEKINKWFIQVFDIQKPTNHRNLSILLLCLTSGIVDANGYLHLGHVFVANMTGNFVMLGLAIGHAEGLAVLRSIIALIGFIVGNVLAASIFGRTKESTVWPTTVTTTLIAECLILVAFDLIAEPMVTNQRNEIFVLIALLSMAMGIQTTAARRLGVSGISTTVLTNNLASVIEDLTAQFRKSTDIEIQTKPLPIDLMMRASAIVTYCIGAVISVVAEQQYPFAIIWMPICIIGGIIFITLTCCQSSLSNQNL